MIRAKARVICSSLSKDVLSVMQKHSGFSLIELMTVIAMISILVTLAIPSYQGYIQKAYFAEVIAATAPYKTAITLALQEGVDLKDCQAGHYGIPQAIQKEKGSIEKITVQNGIITAIGSKRAGSYSYILTPEDNASEWAVSGSCLEAGFCRV